MGRNQGSQPSREFHRVVAILQRRKPRLNPDERVAKARSRVLRLEAALMVLGKDSPEAQPIKEALKKAQGGMSYSPNVRNMIKGSS